MSAVRSIDSAAGGATAFQVSQLATLADAVKIAQSAYQSALTDLHRAQDKAREAADAGGSADPISGRVPGGVRSGPREHRR